MNDLGLQIPVSTFCSLKAAAFLVRYKRGYGELGCIAFLLNLMGFVFFHHPSCGKKGQQECSLSVSCL